MIQSQLGVRTGAAPVRDMSDHTGDSLPVFGVGRACPELSEGSYFGSYNVLPLNAVLENYVAWF